MMSNRRESSAAVGIAASVRRVDSEAANSEATVVSLDSSSASRALPARTLKVVGVWAMRPWYGP